MSSNSSDGRTVNTRVSNNLGIQWAPLDIPMSRRLQTLAATAYICLILLGEPLAILLTIKLIYSRFWWLILTYCAWMLYDIDICSRGGRGVEWVKNWTWWAYYRDYFPLSLIKTTELDPSRNYLFACFPHGVVGTGVFGAFGTNALNFRRIFPGMTCNLITLNGHFQVPLFRELALSLGLCSSSKQSLMHLLDKKKYTGKCVALIVGGAAESLDSHPGEYVVTLKRRKGFIRVAMATGTPLVPVFSFGEPDVFRPLNNPKDSWLRRFQERVRRITGISPMFPVGRGILQYTFGVLPLRSPIHNVVGAPMEVQRNTDPTAEEVDAVHQEFTARLIQLFESEKHKYLKDHENTRLTIT